MLSVLMQLGIVATLLALVGTPLVLTAMFKATEAVLLSSYFSSAYAVAGLCA